MRPSPRSNGFDLPRISTASLTGMGTADRWSAVPEGRNPNRSSQQMLMLRPPSDDKLRANYNGQLGWGPFDEKALVE